MCFLVEPTTVREQSDQTVNTLVLLFLTPDPFRGVYSLSDSSLQGPTGNVANDDLDSDAH